MQQINSLMEESNHGTNESSEEANRLKLLAEDLQRIVSRFDLAV